MKTSDRMKHQILVNQFSSVCDAFAQNTHLLAAYAHHPLTAHVTPQIQDLRINSIDRWWWQQDDYSRDYMQGVTKTLRHNPNYVDQAFKRTLCQVMNNGAVFTELSAMFINSGAPYTHAGMQKSHYSAHAAAYATDFLQTSGFQGLKETIESAEVLTVLPAVIIDRSARQLDSAFCLSVEVRSNDQSPVAPHLRQIPHLVAA